MQTSDFRSILATFADPGTDILFDKTRVLISVNGDVIDAAVTTQSGDVYVDEGSGPEPASKWILTRLARLPLLATRLRETVSPTEFFVSPSGTLLPTLQSDSQDNEVNDALGAALKMIDGRSPLETTVLYLTSDAGEGKTTLINQLAREQAQRFSENKSDWLLVPISLGGRHFLRFDDITVGALQNRYRFPFLYYNSFLSLVRMGVLVPAFDGFEEMFVESSSGEALSAMGILVGSLNSNGALVVAARKAYFEFENLKSQEKLFDTIRGFFVGFGKLELKRWGKIQFLEYCDKRGVTNGEEFYCRISERLGEEHPLITRAVLVKRLIDVTQERPSLDILLGELLQAGADYFSVFVRSIIEREANEKWIDRSGQNAVGSPLLSVDEHCELLSQIAVSMWEARIDNLKQEMLEFVADYFCEMARKNTFQAQQIRNRIRGHALLVPSGNTAQSIEFDHDEFRLFFLGEGVANQIRPLNARAKVEVLNTFRRGVLPRQAQHALISAIIRDQSLDRTLVVKFLEEVKSMDAQASYTQENCSDIIIRLLSGVACQHLSVGSISFGLDALRDRKLTGVEFHDCYFAETSLEATELKSCTFLDCRFAQLRIFNSTVFESVSFQSCTVDALLLKDVGREIWGPKEIQRKLRELGVALADSDQDVIAIGAPQVVDDEILAIEKMIRYFMRSTHISESVMLIKLGNQGQDFINHALPELVKRNVFVRIENRGSGVQLRFRLGVPLNKLNQAITLAAGSFSKFLAQFITQ